MTGINSGVAENDTDHVFGIRVDAGGGGGSSTRRNADDVDERPAQGRHLVMQHIKDPQKR
eukprot:6319454-Pyramimonas_sp.AAC.1